MTSKNADQLIRQPDVDGFLVGGASLHAEELADIVAIVAKSDVSA